MKMIFRNKEFPHMPNIENIITAKEFSLQDILSNKKYSVDFFQREYSWKKGNIVQLIYDLISQ